MADSSHTGDLELEQDLDFERRRWAVERVGQVVMAVVVLAALAGLFGPGALSRMTAGEEDEGLRLEYSRFGRFRAPLTVQVHVGAQASRHGWVRLWLSREYLADAQVEQVTPHPAQTEAGAERLTYVFPAGESSRATVITFSLKPEQIGRKHGCMGLADGPTLCFRQFIYP